MSRVAIDLTPVLPGGENGGAKIMTLELIKNLARQHLQDEFIVLTLTKNHQELSCLDAPNVKRVCMDAQQEPHKEWGKFFFRWYKTKIRRICIFLSKKCFLNLLPSQLRSKYEKKIKKIDIQLFSDIRDIAKLVEIKDLCKIDLLFCPFTAPFYHQLGIPLVSVIYDLQYQQYPGFFTQEDRYHRDQHFKKACEYATRLVCISNFVRKTVLESSDFPAEKVDTIYISLAQRLPIVVPSKSKSILRRFGLVEKQFLLFPANFWRHKNHKMLFTAFAMYRHQFPGAALKLVCTGAPGERLNFWKNAITIMKLENEVIFPGYLNDVEFSMLMQSCLAVIFPSLYEGFGMPILEAMVNSKPVLCSNSTSLPEIAGDAAIFFDPRKPEDIMRVMHELEINPKLVEQCIQSGKERISFFGTAEAMAQQYWQVFQAAMQDKSKDEN